MAIEYRLIDIDNNQLSLNGATVVSSVQAGSLVITSENVNREARTVERSYLPGNQLISEPRIKSRDITITYDVVYSDDNDFRFYQNSLLEFLHRAIYLLDVTNDKRLRIEFRRYRPRYDEGGYQKFAGVSVQFIALDAFWEDNTPQTGSGGTATGTAVTFSLLNDGFHETPAIFYLKATDICSSFSIINDTTEQGIIINDIGFGATGFDDYTIDNANGEALLETLLRNRLIVPGTGFFNLQVGVNAIEIETTIPVDVTYTFRRRYYLG